MGRVLKLSNDSWLIGTFMENTPQTYTMHELVLELFTLRDALVRASQTLSDLSWEVEHERRQEAKNCTDGLLKAIQSS